MYKHEWKLKFSITQLFYVYNFSKVCLSFRKWSSHVRVSRAFFFNSQIFVRFSPGVYHWGAMGVFSPPPLYPTSISEGPTISISNTRDIAFYWCSKIILTRNLAIFTMYATSLEQFLAVFHFSNYIQIDHFKLDLLKNVR